jgi:hypothetical protein
VSTVILAADSAALPPARAELARINAQIAAVKAQRDEAQRLLDQWQGPESELALVETQLQELRAQRERDRAAWNERGCPGDPPADPPDLLTLERARARLRDRLGANDNALAAAAGVAQRVQERLAALSLQKRSAHLRAALEACRERLDGHGIAAIIASLSELAVLQSIVTVLGNQRDPESVAVSREIDQMIAIARRSYGVRGELEAAQCFLEELASDPAAQIPDPAPPIVERLDPGIPRGGVEDRTECFNRGPSGGPLDEVVPGMAAPPTTASPEGSGDGFMPPRLSEPSGPTFMPAPRLGGGG